MLPMSPIAGIAMAPINHQTVDVMRTELCKFMILTKSAEVIPLTMQAPKRQYLDFHADVMPSVRSMGRFGNAFGIVKQQHRHSYFCSILAR
jgi:hypothetical protein